MRLQRNEPARVPAYRAIRGAGAPASRWFGADARRSLADFAYVSIESVSWFAGCILTVLGCAVAMFLVFSHGQVDVFFAHVDNLASRYVSADLGRRAVIEHQLGQAFMIAVTICLALRGPSFVGRLRRDLKNKVSVA